MTDRTRYSAGNTTFDVVNHIFGRGSFTRSNGKAAARVYERLTKASRRRQLPGGDRKERAYRHGVRDALAALRTDLSS